MSINSRQIVSYSVILIRLCQEHLLILVAILFWCCINTVVTVIGPILLSCIQSLCNSDVQILLLWILAILHYVCAHCSNIIKYIISMSCGHCCIMLHITKIPSYNVSTRSIHFQCHQHPTLRKVPLSSSNLLLSQNQSTWDITAHQISPRGCSGLVGIHNWVKICA